MSMPMSRLRIGVVIVPLLALLILATGSAPASAQGAQAFLRLHEIVCHRDFDPFGSDEPYLKVNNQRIWSGGGVDPGEHHSLEGVALQSFSNSIILVLMEDDFGADDSLGAYQFYAEEANQGSHIAAFFANSSPPELTCSITYEVLG